MIFNSRERAKAELAEHLAFRDKLLIDPDGLKEYSGVVEVQEKNGKKYYRIVQNNNGQRQKKYLAAGSEMLLAMQRSRTLNEILKEVDANIKALENFIDSYHSIDPASLSQRLPKPYRNEALISGIFGKTEDAAAWKKRKLAERSMYPQRYTQYLVHEMNDGEMARSKSEMIIGNFNLSIGIPFVYESPLLANGMVYHIDFVYLNRSNGKELFHEHFGRMNDPEYREQVLKRIHMHMLQGHIPGINLLLTFEDLEGHFSSRRVTENIVDFLKRNNAL